MCMLPAVLHPCTTHSAPSYKHCLLLTLNTLYDTISYLKKAVPEGPQAHRHALLDQGMSQ